MSKRDAAKRVPILLEVRVKRGSAVMSAMMKATDMQIEGLELDEHFEPIPMAASQPETDSKTNDNEETYILRGTAEEDKIKEIEKQPDVVKVWRNTKIAPFAGSGSEGGNIQQESSEVCDFAIYDCNPEIPKGSISDVVMFLGVDKIWRDKFRGNGIVVGVVDGGITAQGRQISQKDTAKTGWKRILIPHVINGWPANSWGTTGEAWNWHGNMSSFDVLGIAPDVKLYDMRISDGSLPTSMIDMAIQAYQWAINQHRTDGTPHILTNSWGIWQESWDPEYANYPNHPFTRKVVEAIEEGIICLFAAGNCGNLCPPMSQCGVDLGPGRSIWGANGHPKVMTVSAANIQGQLIGYSSQGPAALDPNKPDFCGISHFTGYNLSDSGTSASCPVVSGIVALVKQAKPSVTQDEIKDALKITAASIGGAIDFTNNSGSGIVNAKRAFDYIINPTEHQVINPNIKSNIIPTIPPVVKPNINPAIHPVIDPNINPFIKQRINPNINIKSGKHPVQDIQSQKKLPTQDRPPVQSKSPPQDTTPQQDTYGTLDTNPQRDRIPLIRTTPNNDKLPPVDKSPTTDKVPYQDKQPQKDKLPTKDRPVQSKNPLNDKLPKTDVLTNPFSDRINVRSRAGLGLWAQSGRSPFILATPHHAPGLLAKNFNETRAEYESNLLAYESEMEQYEIAAQEIILSIQQANEQLELLQAEYENLCARYYELYQAYEYLLAQQENMETS